MKNTFLIIPAILLITSCDLINQDEKKESDTKYDLTILYTNDEHGWMEAQESSDGAARMMGLWREQEGYTEDGPFLILSGGDNWTGPAISTWFQGKSMVEVMNAMHYDAAAIGNHEFDFTIPVLYNRVGEAEFPYLSANIYEEDGSIPDFVQPWVIREVNSIMVGIIGLTTNSTPYSTFPDHVESLRFGDYETALEATVPVVRAEGADLIIVIAHICEYEMDILVPILEELGVSIIGGGHCNDLVAKQVGNVVIIEGGQYMRSYAKVDLSFDVEADTIVSISPGTALNSGGPADGDVAAVVSAWRALANQELAIVIGYTTTGINRYSAMMHNLVTDSWLAAIPSADIAMSNAGGIRQSIPAGHITKETIISVLPFDNNIIQLELTGSQVIDCIGNYIVGGMFIQNGSYYHPDSTEIVSDSVYKVLTTDYLYARDDTPFSGYDSDPYYTGLNYHQPTIDYIISFETSTGNPLENHLDGAWRR